MSHNVTFHRKTSLIEHFDLGQRVFQMPSHCVCKAFAKRLQRVWKKFEMVLKGFVKHLKGFGRSLKACESVLMEFVKRLKKVCKAFERSL